MSDEPRSVLDVVEEIDRKLDAKSDSDEARFMAHESMLRDHERRHDESDEKHKAHEERHRNYDRQIHDQAALLVTLGQSTARAMDSSLLAQQAASRTKEECVTIVESAIRMHSASISATVGAVVKAELAPVVAEVDKVKKSTAAQDGILAGQDKKLDAILVGVKATTTAIGHPYLRFLVVSCLALGTLGGAAYAAYEAATAAAITKKDHP